MTTPPVAWDLDDAPAPAMSYRQAYDAGLPVASPNICEPTRSGLLHHAPDPLRAAVGSAWALVSLTAAGAVLVLLVLVVVRVAGVLA